MIFQGSCHDSREFDSQPLVDKIDVFFRDVFIIPVGVKQGHCFINVEK